jgi:PTH1 family peptidyl-tRNA hydrolase
MFKLLIGIGNPGRKYNNTRHNIGWEVIDAFNKIIESENVYKNKEYEISKGIYNYLEIYTMKPLTYVNNSGLPLKKVIKKLNLKIEEVLIFVDDINLPLGITRLKTNGSAGGHNGLKSIFNEMQTQNIARLRLGVGVKDIYNHELIPFVLGKFKKTEYKYVDEMIKESLLALDNIFQNGIVKAMESTNRKSR